MNISNIVNQLRGGQGTPGEILSYNPVTGAIQRRPGPGWLSPSSIKESFKEAERMRQDWERGLPVPEIERALGPNSSTNKERVFGPGIKREGFIKRRVQPLQPYKPPIKQRVMPYVPPGKKVDNSKNTWQPRTSRIKAAPKVMRAEETVYQPDGAYSGNEPNWDVLFNPDLYQSSQPTMQPAWQSAPNTTSVTMMSKDVRNAPIHQRHTAQTKRFRDKYGMPTSMVTSRQIPTLSGLNANPFDLALGYYDDDDGLDGLWSSIKKEARRFEKKVNKARRSLYKKTLPGSVADKLIKLEKNPKIRKAVKVAAVAAGAYFAGPAILAGLKTAGAAAAPYVKGAGSLIVKGAGGVAKGAASVAKFGTKLLATQATAQQVLGPRTPGIMAGVDEISQTPEFMGTYGELESQGYTPEQIAQIWGNSQTYRNTAIPSIAQAIYPDIASTYENAGIPPGIARPAAEEEAIRQADDAVTRQNQKGNVLIPLAIGALLLS